MRGVCQSLVFYLYNICVFACVFLLLFSILLYAYTKCLLSFNMYHLLTHDPMLGIPVFNGECFNCLIQYNTILHTPRPCIIMASKNCCTWCSLAPLIIHLHRVERNYTNIYFYNACQLQANLQGGSSLTGSKNGMFAIAQPTSRDHDMTSRDHTHYSARCKQIHSSCPMELS